MLIVLSLDEQENNFNVAYVRADNKKSNKATFS